MHRVWHMRQKRYGCKGDDCNANYNTTDQGKPYQRAMVQRLSYTEMYMTKPAQMHYELAEEYGYTFIHPFDDLDVATGQGTIAMEIVKELPLVDYILVPIGGGGLATGVSTLAKMLNPKIKVIGVEPAGAALYDRLL